MKRTIRRSVVLVAVAGLLATLASVQAQSLAEPARNLIKNYEWSLWTVNVDFRQTLTLGDQTGQQEGRASTVGTLVDAGNLIAVPQSVLDPSDLFRASNPQAAKAQIKTEVVSILVELPGGGTVPATVVHEDKALDLAFLAPTSPLPKEAVPVRLANSARPAVLDLGITLSRSNTTVFGQSVVVANAGYIQGVIGGSKPVYLYEHAGMPFAGAPVFLPDGKLIGLILMHFTYTPQPDGTTTVSTMGVVLPAEAVAKAAQDAQAALKKGQ